MELNYGVKLIWGKMAGNKMYNYGESLLCFRFLPRPEISIPDRIFQRCFIKTNWPGIEATSFLAS